MRASARTGLAPQTLSGQIATLEAALGVTLFQRQGRGLVLTDAGRMALDYAEEIFRLGSELEEALHSRASGRTAPFRVGIADVVPKEIAYLLLAPAMKLAEPMRIICREGKLEGLLGELAIHKLDVVLADSPLPSNMDVRGYSHTLGACGIGFYATPALAATLQGKFPDCLDGAPLLLPGMEASVRSPLLRWLEAAKLRPRIVGEFQDSALLTTFGRAGLGFFPAPLALAGQVASQLDAMPLGEMAGVSEQIYAISNERRIRHPAIEVLCAAAPGDVPGHGV